ncbi:hypothetical protein [Rubritepida flocculans]|jgi:hypothetical protein|uniref:hypothetical protein n=1 Tax=Rubritepida flocculans TaxID=182403 RepID=UPI00041C4B1F|nr:hypothetical protein [Rubritepida flocculans]
MRPGLFLLCGLLLAPPALAQPAPVGPPDMRRQGENWHMGQDLHRNENPARPGRAAPSSAQRRAQRQAQQQRPITGTGRPVARPPAPTPGGPPVPRSTPPGR